MCAVLALGCHSGETGLLVHWDRTHRYCRDFKLACFAKMENAIKIVLSTPTGTFVAGILSIVFAVLLSGEWLAFRHFFIR